MFASTTGGVAVAPLSARMLASSDCRATELGKVYVLGSLTGGTYVYTPTTSPLFWTRGVIEQSPVIEPGTSVNRAAPGLAEAVHLTGGWSAQEAAIEATAVRMANARGSWVMRLWFTAEFLPLTVVYPLPQNVPRMPKRNVRGAWYELALL